MDSMSRKTQVKKILTLIYDKKKLVGKRLPLKKKKRITTVLHIFLRTRQEVCPLQNQSRRPADRTIIILKSTRAAKL